MIFFIYDVNKYGKYEKNDLILSVISFYFQNVGCIYITYAIKMGKGGIVDAVDNLKSLWQTLIVVILSKFEKMPTNLQILGMTSGLLGATIIFINQ